ncbi:MAG: hypothetical protein JGK24_16735 [Microcoleus sp. PH2017_29_MFU_D_A]|jgi:hypothetical protein|uniref:hypothetical protein n=1 Tax=unclassified Microcoleus TaxID=2642155 RepID=UPI001D5B7319|nr:MULTISPECIES: hypothetical protein [unclassified Microcoleus]MCC3417916.1 hypothetical protein [Microcoleus sp. PH2017_07_MST_O_A]MCC3431935.1 hypothetical protein [Microcoleus sp. PH2017_04_SCI_O_A]MCC3444842.1 hypothetical protein [Microcoleus sp. PH2017_03_ELD_O_A]MCC3469028.1 hypothetical protein [Microcoleus sp. PH2017_06_SFM_O_A]MCC3506376.1 hypothetical protein [Microcoleus sp. PH2017_19_SFW_U_A]MCC3508890.1 hypothetical protein [Microcoleus sp. PH2017_17_BER_D_A]TAE06741.1 MAG: hy
MTKQKILQEGREYTFRSYFDLPYETDQILAEFDYSLSKGRLSLPKTTRQLDRLIELRDKIEDILPLVSLSSEIARRESLVSPVLLDLIRYCQCQLRFEYTLNVNSWLKGNLDYLVKSNQELLVIEAKNDDMTRGFTQLAVQLIAMSHVEDQNIFYGAVTMGDVWRFGKLDRNQQTIFQDTHLFRVPDDLDDLFKVMVGILDGDEISR